MRSVGRAGDKGVSGRENARRMLRDLEDSFSLLPVCTQRGHLYRVRLIIPYPQTRRADAVTLKARLCKCECRILCGFVLGVYFNSAAKVQAWCACAAPVSPSVRQHARWHL